jgi:hypothetical protein
MTLPVALPVDDRLEEGSSLVGVDRSGEGRTLGFWR